MEAPRIMTRVGERARDKRKLTSYVWSYFIFLQLADWLELEFIFLALRAACPN